MRNRKSFRPLVYADWLPIFKTMSEHERSEVLLAIASFPDYEPENVALWSFFREQLEKQLDAYREKCDKNQRIAHEREQNRTQRSERTRTCTNVSERTRTSTQEHERTPNLLPITYNLVPKKEIDKEKTHPSPSARTASVSPTRVPSIQKPEGVESEDWQAYLKLRKQKRLPLTQRALDSMLAEAEKVSMTPQQMIVCCLEHSWASFRADWYEKEQSEKPFDIDEYIRKNAASFDDYVPQESEEGES